MKRMQRKYVWAGVGILLGLTVLWTVQRSYLSGVVSKNQQDRAEQLDSQQEEQGEVAVPTVEQEVPQASAVVKKSPIPSPTPVVTIKPTATPTPTVQPTATPNPSIAAIPLPQPSPVDTEPPVIVQMTGPADGSTVDFNTFCFPTYATDNSSGQITVRYSFDSGPNDWNTNYSPCFYDVRNGWHTFVIQARDAAGNVSETRSSYFNVQVETQAN